MGEYVAATQRKTHNTRAWSTTSTSGSLLSATTAVAFIKLRSTRFWDFVKANLWLKANLWFTSTQELAYDEHCVDVVFQELCIILN